MLVTNYQTDTIAEIAKRANRMFTKRLLISVMKKEYKLDCNTEFQVRRNIRGIFKSLLLDESCFKLLKNNVIRSAEGFEFSQEDDLYVCLYGVAHEVSLLYMEGSLSALCKVIGFDEIYSDYLVSYLYTVLLDHTNQWGQEFETFLAKAVKECIEEEMYQNLELSLEISN
jgi:hypothetical protein